MKTTIEEALYCAQRKGNTKLLMNYLTNIANYDEYVVDNMKTIWRSNIISFLYYYNGIDEEEFIKYIHAYELAALTLKSYALNNGIFNLDSSNYTEEEKNMALHLFFNYKKIPVDNIVRQLKSVNN